jgi:hypothetical protein
MAILALLAVVGGVMSDVTSDRFWERHALLAGMVSSVIVVVLSIAVINEVLERRRRQRWSILAQYVMFELIRNARMIWSGVLEAAGLFPTTSNDQASIDAGAKSVRDTPGLAAALRGILDDADSRARLHAAIVFLAEHSDEVLGRWAAVMLRVRRGARPARRVGRQYRMDRWPVGLFRPARRRSQTEASPQQSGDSDPERSQRRMARRPSCCDDPTC